MKLYQIVIQATILLALSLSISANIFLWKPAKVILDKYAPPPFSLNENETYYIRQDENESYFYIEVENHSNKRVFVGTTQIPLKPYVDQLVKLDVQYRATLGKPNCYNPCTFNAEAHIVDINNIHVVETD